MANQDLSNYLIYKDLHIAVVGGGAIQFKLESQEDFGTFSQEEFRQYHTGLKFLNLFRNTKISRNWLYFVTSGGSLAKLDLDVVREDTALKKLRCSHAELISSYCEDFDVGKRFIVVLKANGSVSMLKKRELKYNEAANCKLSHCGQTSLSKFLPSSITLLPSMDGCLTCTYGSNSLNIVDLVSFKRGHPPIMNLEQMLYLVAENSASRIIHLNCSVPTGKQTLFVVDAKTNMHLLLACSGSVALLQSLPLNVPSSFVISWKDMLLSVPLSQLVKNSNRVTVVIPKLL